MSNDESMTKYECCSLRFPERNSPDARYPPGAVDTTAISVIRHSSDFLLVNLRGSD
jgi:hypothetical protein